MEIQYPVIVAEYAGIVARSEIQKADAVIAARQTVRQTKLQRRSLETDAILYSVMVAEYSVMGARSMKLQRLETDAILYSVMDAEYSVMGARSMKLQRLDLLLKLNWHFLSKSPFVECTPVALKSGASLVAQT